MAGACAAIFGITWAQWTGSGGAFGVTNFAMIYDVCCSGIVVGYYIWRDMVFIAGLGCCGWRVLRAAATVCFPCLKHRKFDDGGADIWWSTSDGTYPNPPPK
eukprot:12621822-Heterocapsa_arctica.AAC.1